MRVAKGNAIGPGSSWGRFKDWTPLARCCGRSPTASVSTLAAALLFWLPVLNIGRSLDPLMTPLCKPEIAARPGPSRKSSSAHATGRRPPPRCLCKGSRPKSKGPADQGSGSVLKSVTRKPPCATGCPVGRKGRPVAWASEASDVTMPTRHPRNRSFSAAPSAPCKP